MARPVPTGREKTYERIARGTTGTGGGLMMGSHGGRGSGEGKQTDPLSLRPAYSWLASGCASIADYGEGSRVCQGQGGHPRPPPLASPLSSPAPLFLSLLVMALVAIPCADAYRRATCLVRRPSAQGGSGSWARAYSHGWLTPDATWGDEAAPYRRRARRSDRGDAPELQPGPHDGRADPHEP